MNHIPKIMQQEDGAFTLWAAMSGVMLVAVAALAIDLSHGWVVQHELQNVADSAALAAARELGTQYEGLTLAQQQAYTLSSTEIADILNAAQTTAQSNHAGGTAITINSGDIVIGQWDVSTHTLTPSAAQPTGVSVIARRDATANQSLTTFFANIFGVSSIDVAATATAGLTPIVEVLPGELDVPIAISEEWFNQGGACGGSIKFSPTGDLDGCAGWHTFEDTPANAAKLGQAMQDLEAGTYDTPETVAGQTQFEFTGGEVASVFNDFESLYNSKKAADGTWKTFIPVYGATDCSNPSGSITIVGFTTGLITSVVGAPDKIIQAQVECDAIETGRGGGGGNDFGTLGSLPGLVN